MAEENKFTVCCPTPKHVHCSEYTSSYDREVIKAYTCYIAEITGLPIEETSNKLTAFIQSLIRNNYDKYLESYHWKRISSYVKRKAEYGCPICHSEVPLEVHHVSYANIGFEQPSDIEVCCHSCYRERHPEVKNGKI